MSGTAAGRGAADQLPGGEFNAVPYDSNAFALTEPAHVAAVARLFGLRAPEVARARVLELGCASGGNIIPLAARWPEARFAGIDLSVRHVEMARQHIGSLGLTNIDIRQGDIGTIDFGTERFDYIICHGVYSWVPKAVRDRILAICREHLTEDGVACVSYNVLPGWHMRRVVRDLFTFHTGSTGTPQQRIAKSRWLLDKVAATGADATPYRQLLRHEAGLLAKQSDGYILGEFLVEENEPCYFSEFVAAAGSAGLAYLSESELAAGSLAAALTPQFGELLEVLSGADPIAYEQYLDFFRGRSFRQTLLVHEGRQPSAARRLQPQAIARLHLSTRLSINTAKSEGSTFVLEDPSGRSIRSNDAPFAQAMDALAAAYPDTRQLEELCQPLAGTAEHSAARARFTEALGRLISVGLVGISAVPTRVGRARDERPTAWSLARADAAAGRSTTTTLRHTTIRISQPLATLLPLMDGTRDHGALRAALGQLMQREDAGTGSLSASPMAPQHEPDSKVSAALAGLLDGLEKAGLLVPPSG